ncbi:MAG: protein kinase, partial [Candidatus Celaenobacter antarcticus]|nr:protein kinase [Candidatus Celaenobacter antarcticus]
MSLIALHHEFKEKIGTGSFGTVYKVEDIATKKIFAVKLFDKIPIEDIREKMNPKVMREITKISHPNLIKIYDYGIYQNNLYLLSEFFKSKGLPNFHLTNKNKQDFFELITQVCYALNHLHTHHIIHKDLKLENVLYQKSSNKINVKVCDYGFNKIISQTEAYPESEVVSLPYIAPELLQGSSFSPKSDFYALGVIMYYLSVGTFPFSREEIKLMSEKKIPNIIPKFPTKINPAVDKKLEDLIFHLIEFNPALRIGKSQEIIRYINEMQDTTYPLTIEPPLVKQIESRQFHFRDKDIDTLRDRINEVKNQKGEIIFVTGEKGVGKTSLMQYIKWYLLSEDFHVFYYNCNPQHRDPFFMLCKEIFLSMDEKGKYLFEQSASNKFCEFLFKSEEKSLKIIEDESDLMRDFELARDYMFGFSSTKPIVYFITNIEEVNEPTINFLEYIAPDLPNHPIVIIVSSYNPYIVDFSEITYKIHIEPLSQPESFQFISEILGEGCPEEFLYQIYLITNGNQRFILELIGNLIEKKIILDVKGNWHFDVNILEVELPKKILTAIEEKIALIPEKIKNLLVQLSVLQIPLSTNIIQTILHFSDSKDLFFFMQDVEALDILVKNDEYAEDG